MDARLNDLTALFLLTERRLLLRGPGTLGLHGRSQEAGDEIRKVLAALDGEQSKLAVERLIQPYVEPDTLRNWLAGHR